MVKKAVVVKIRQNGCHLERSDISLNKVRQTTHLTFFMVQKFAPLHPVLFLFNRWVGNQTILITDAKSIGPVILVGGVRTAIDDIHLHTVILRISGRLL